MTDDDTKPLPIPTVFAEIGAPDWKLPPLTTPAGLKKIIVDAVAPILPDVKVRALLDVNTQKLHVQISGQRPTYDEFQAAILRKIAATCGIPYDRLFDEWPPKGDQDD